MLPAARRMRRSVDFTAAVRRGRRAWRPTLVLHVRSRQECSEPARVGLIVSKAVGNAVTRHRVSRRLRAVCAQGVDGWGAGDLVVIRALPAAAAATSDQLANDLDQAASRLGLAHSADAS
ncbi:MAG: ribonuclease P protein component [Actinomycetia bacterium]|nr:ribonuclease P protein component [Actinomycetes bacterium]